MARYSLVGDPPVFDPGVFPWTRNLEENWVAIRDEVAGLLANRGELPSISAVSPNQGRLDYQRRWKTFFLWGYGYRVDENCRAVPRTAALVDEIPDIISALFSIHEPGTHLPRHRGVTKGIITCHLGLMIPQCREGCRIAVEDRSYGWTAGKFFVFDDTRYHEVWNDTDEDRVILLLHVRRPLRAPGSWIESIFFQAIRMSPFVQQARRNLRLRRGR